MNSTVLPYNIYYSWERVINHGVQNSQATLCHNRLDTTHSVEGLVAVTAGSNLALARGNCEVSASLCSL